MCSIHGGPRRFGYEASFSVAVVNLLDGTVKFYLEGNTSFMGVKKGLNLHLKK